MPSDDQLPLPLPPPPPPAPAESVPDVPVNRPLSTCFGAPASPGDRRSTTSRLRLGTFNTGGLFDGVDDAESSSVWNGGTACPGYDPPTRLCDAAGAAAYLSRLQSLLLNLRADILNINNVEDCAILHMLVGTQGRNRDGVHTTRIWKHSHKQTNCL